MKEPCFGFEIQQKGVLDLMRCKLRFHNIPDCSDQWWFRTCTDKTNGGFILFMLDVICKHGLRQASNSY